MGAGGDVGAGVGVVLGTVKTQSWVEPGAVAIRVNVTYAKVPDPENPAEFEPAKVSCPVAGWVADKVVIASPGVAFLY